MRSLIDLHNINTQVYLLLFVNLYQLPPTAQVRKASTKYCLYRVRIRTSASTGRVEQGLITLHLTIILNEQNYLNDKLTPSHKICLEENVLKIGSTYLGRLLGGERRQSAGIGRSPHSKGCSYVPLGHIDR